MAYKTQQTMDYKWQIARKIDRIDLGSFAALEFFWRNAILFGLIRAIDPVEPVPAEGEDPDPSKVPIPNLITSIDSRIKSLTEFDTTAMLMGKLQLSEVKDFQRSTMSVWYENAEVIGRCKLTDLVRVRDEDFG